MALINCPDCKKEISDTAENCIHCGYFFNKKNHESNVTKILIEKTDKKWKRLKLISFLMFIFGIILMLSGFSIVQNNPEIREISIISTVGTLSFLCSFFVYFYASFNTWWQHK